MTRTGFHIPNASHFEEGTLKLVRVYRDNGSAFNVIKSYLVPPIELRRLNQQVYHDISTLPL